MEQQIEKLKKEREKLTTEYKNNQTEYKAEIKRIDRAIRNFQRGMNELNGNGKPKVKSSSVIEEILTESEPLHLKILCEKLNERGIPMAYQSLSGLLQSYAKAGKKFVKTAPATFGLLSTAPENTESMANEQIKAEPEKPVNEEKATKKEKSPREGKAAKKEAVEEETTKEVSIANDRTIVYDEDTNRIISED